tara:strand:- start:6545 stop:6874 length:330 start_codon:yes stop_codon:yes gene_type:complete
MEKFWEKALKVTGPVAVVGFLIWVLLKFVFREDVVALFGSEKLFVIVLILLSILAIALITSILVYKGKEPEKEQQTPQGEGNMTIIDRSKIEGDVVSGDKYVNTKGKNE